MSAPYDTNAGEGTAFDAESGLAGKNLDAFRAHASAQDETYILGPGSMPQQPDPNPWLRDTAGKVADES